MMVLFFGQLAEIAGVRELEMSGASNTSELKEMLSEKFPGLKHMLFNIAVDTLIVDNETALLPASTVALLPPFSGG